MNQRIVSTDFGQTWIAALRALLSVYRITPRDLLPVTDSATCQALLDMGGHNDERQFAESLNKEALVAAQGLGLFARDPRQQRWSALLLPKKCRPCH